MYTCDNCGYSTKVKRYLECHYNRKTPCVSSVFKCNGCDKIFSRKYNLDRHMEKCKGKGVVIGEEVVKKEIILNHYNYPDAMKLKKKDYKKIVYSEEPIVEFMRLLYENDSNHSILLKDKDTNDYEVFDGKKICVMDGDLIIMGLIKELKNTLAGDLIDMGDELVDRFEEYIIKRDYTCKDGSKVRTQFKVKDKTVVDEIMLKAEMKGIKKVLLCNFFKIKDKFDKTRFELADTVNYCLQL